MGSTSTAINTAIPATRRRGWRGLHRPVASATVGLLTLGALALLLGCWVYASAREPSRSLLMPTLPWPPGRSGFGPLAQWLPSAMHALAFSLFTAVALPPGRLAWRYAGCALWALLGLLFEFGQHPWLAPGLAAAARQLLGDNLLATALARYVLAGTFDPGDLLATVLGAGLAALILSAGHHGTGAHHAP